MRQSANAQSARGTSRTSRWTPAAVSLPTLISRAPGWARSAGGYAGGGLPMVACRSGSVVVPGAALAKRASIRPVIDEPSALRATGTAIVCLSAAGGRSPCQPLTSETWPSAEAVGAPLPRLTTL